MEKAQRRALLGVTIGHGAHDTWYGVAAILMAAMSGDLGLRNSDIALALLFYQGISSITQPLFGRLSERVGGRPLAVSSILWTTLCFSLLLFAQDKWVLMALISLSGLGSGAWHPQGAANAVIAGGKRWGATASSIFFFGGTLGSAVLGAAAGGFLLDRYGPRSLLIISAITIWMALGFVRTMVPRWVETPERSGQVATGGQANGGNGRLFWSFIIVLLVGTALRRVAAETMQTFMPKYQEDLGVATAAYAALMSAYMIASAVGGVLGSYLSDRIGLRRVLTVSVLLSAVALWGFLQTTGPLSYALFVLTGLLLNPSHTLFMIACQRQFPQRMATVTGAFLGYAFVSGAVGAWGVGLAADKVGLFTMFTYMPWLLLGSAIFGYLGVRRVRPAAQPEPTPA
jgi:FSR family fosmidomycin resistance protein-like MFS transporter